MANDNNGTNDSVADLEERPVHKYLTVKGKLGCIGFCFNPIVTVCSAVVIWGFVAWCILQPKETLRDMSTIKTWITDSWTWLYIATSNIWIIFILCLAFSKYSKLKLGKDDEKPEFSDITYFTMLFAAGMGIGLFYFGVAEPIFHFNSENYGNRYWNRSDCSYMFICFQFTSYKIILLSSILSFILTFRFTVLSRYSLFQ